MLSLQTIFQGKGRVFDLLEASAETAVEAATAANRLAAEADPAPLMATFTAARRREKDLAAEISQELVNTFITVLDREDAEAMNAALYKIPKTIGKFAERHALVARHLPDVDFSARTGIMLRCAEIVTLMVRELRNGFRIGPMRELQRKLQALESEADDLLLESWRDPAITESDPLRMILSKDLFETLEAAIDKCRDVGNVVYSIALKHA